MNHTPELWGRPRDDIYGPYNQSYLQTSHQTSGPNSHTQSPLVTGTSEIGIKFKDGVVLAADNLASYGSLARFTPIHRLIPFNSQSVLGFSGDISDMQHIHRMLDSLSVRENYRRETYSSPITSTANTVTSDEDSAATATDPKTDIDAKNLHTYVSKVMYRRRSEINPLWNAILVAGLEHVPSPKPESDSSTPGRSTKPFLAFVDLLGTTFTSPTLATGFGAHLAQPILRRKVPNEQAAEQLTRDEAVALVKECMKVLFYRDARSTDRYSLAVIQATGEQAAEAEKLGGSKVDISYEEQLEGQSWAFAETIRGYGTQTN